MCTRRPWVILLIWGMWAGGACAGADAGGSPSVRDSAGVRIVENTAFRWGDAEAWRLESEPAVAIGVVEGAPEQQLYRVVATARLRDRRIVVANGGTHEVRFYDTEGRFLSAVGREGAGPGEFRSIIRMHRLKADSLAVADFMTRRVSLFSEDGSFVRSYPMPQLPGASAPALIGFMDDGALVLSASMSRPRGERPRPGFTRDSTIVYISSHGRAGADTLGKFPGRGSFVRAEGGSILVAAVPYVAQPAYAISGDRILFGDGESFEVRIYGTDGTLRSLLRLRHENAPVLPSDLERLRERRRGSVSDAQMRDRLEAMYADMPIPSHMPAYGRLLTDSAGNLWVESYRTATDEQPSWTVFDPEGAALGVVDGPAGFTADVIGDDYVLGRSRDELDVERVELYRIVKTEH